ncbi:MAG: recombinase family protein [Actinomycetota bacterium]
MADGALKADIRDQATVARIKELQQQGASLRDIAIALKEEGHRPKRGGERWHPETIRRLIARSS